MSTLGGPHHRLIGIDETRRRAGKAPLKVDRTRSIFHSTGMTRIGTPTAWVASAGTGRIHCAGRGLTRERRAEGEAMDTDRAIAHALAPTTRAIAHPQPLRPTRALKTERLGDRSTLTIGSDCASNSKQLAAFHNDRPSLAGSVTAKRRDAVAPAQRSFPECSAAWLARPALRGVCSDAELEV